MGAVYPKPQRYERYHLKFEYHADGKPNIGRNSMQLCAVPTGPWGDPRMARKLSVVALFALSIMVVHFAGLRAEPPGNDPATKYQMLLADAKQGNKPVDWQALRLAYADSPEFDVLGKRTAALRQQMFDAFNAGDFAAAIARAQAILDVVYVDIDAHAVSEQSYEKLGNSTASK